MKKSSFVFSSLVCFSVIPELLVGLPKDPSVVAGDVTIQHQTPQKMIVHTSDKAIINYKSFDIQRGEKVQFVQPSSSSSVLNRVTGKKASKILGQMESNGRIVLVNPNGMYFGPHASVKAASLVASALDISNEDFLQGNHRFRLTDKDSLAEIRNDGLLAAAPEGAVVLMAPIIRNLGTIQARAGKVVLAAGEEVTLDFHGDKLLQFAVEGDIKGAIIDHLGDIHAEGGDVFMRLPTAKRAIKDIINREGIERGEVFVEENGEIYLVAASSVRAKNVYLEASSLSVDGNIDVSSESSRGGEVRLTGANIALRGSKIDASGFSGGGDVLIGGEYQGGGSTPYASSVSMDSTSQILANATEEGSGGNVVLWSLQQTDFEGSIFAQGGFQSGDGGSVETSSIENLYSSRGHVNTSSPNGKLGQWLLDPSVLFIVGSGGSTNPGCSGGMVDVSTFTSSTSNVTLCSNLIFQQVPIAMLNPNAGLIFTAPSGQTGILHLDGGNIITQGGTIVVENLTMILSVSTVFDTTRGGLFPNGADITMGTIDGAITGAGTLSITAGQHLINVTDIGVEVPLGAVSMLARQAYTQSIITDHADITISAPIVLTDNAIFSTELGGGGNITLQTVDALVAGEQSFTVLAGTGTFTSVGIGTNFALGDVSILSAAPLIDPGNIFTQQGVITVVPSIKLTQTRTAMKTFSELNTLLSSDIMLGDVLATVNLMQSLDVRGGLRGKVTIGDVGSSSTNVKHVIITANQPMHIGEVYAADLVIVGASGTINLDGQVNVIGELGIAGSDIYLGAPINAAIVALKARNSILNETVPYPITVSPGQITLNAGRGTVGTVTSPIEVETSGTVLAGGQSVFITGTYGSLQYINGNRPCLVPFRRRLIPCDFAGNIIFPFLSKASFSAFFTNPLNKLGIGYPWMYHGPQFSPFGQIYPATDYRFPYVESENNG